MAPQQPGFQFLPLGAIIQSFVVGKTNIVQGFPKQSLYVSHNIPYFGETIGRYANRIAGAKINSLNSKSYPLAANNGPNSLHGGIVGWGKKVWEGPTPIGARQIPGVEGLQGGETVEFKLRSKDGEEGFPGTVDAKVIYTTGTQTVDGKEVQVLSMDYEVELVEDGSGVEETAINLTNHSYFNLAGKPTIEGTEVSLCTADYLPLDDGGIPITTSVSQYPDVTANEPFTLGAELPDIDDCFVVDPSKASTTPLDNRSEPLVSLVKAYHPDTKIHLEVLSTDPAFQFYTGKWIEVPAVGGLPERVKRSGFCVEPSRYVNAINVDEWKGQVTLKKGQVYGSRTVYRGWSDE